MSHSPTAEVKDPDDVYLDAWQDLAKRIQSGQSFSGRERNCCFLNTRKSQFADVSAVANLDQIDDSRAVAFVDWDHDGDLDLFQANRTGPRIRYLENNFCDNTKSILLRLFGDPQQRCNRDAIGARVQVDVETVDGEQTTMTRTLYAGDAFASQSSKWLHFGLAHGTQVKAVRVRWPGTTDWHTVEGISGDGRYVLEQSKLTARALLPRTPVTLASDTPVESDSENEQARVVLPLPESVLPFGYHSLDKSTSQSAPDAVLSVSDKKRLLVMWAPWCAPCLQELNELKDQANQIADANIEIVAISVDSLSQEISGARAAVADYLAKSPLPFRIGLADDANLKRLTGVWQNAMYRKRKMPIPTSFLVDRRGRLRIVYNGRIAPDQLLDDAAKLEMTDEQIRYAAIPLGGRWADSLFVTNPIAIASVYREELQFSDAEEYLDRFLSKNPLPDKNDSSESARKQRYRIADVMHLAGQIAMDQRQFDRALKLLTQSAEVNPRKVKPLEDAAICLKQLGQLPAALRAMQSALERNPQNADGWNELGVMHLMSRDSAQAATCFERALKINGRAFSAANNLAWIRATSANEKLRDGNEAVRLASILASGPGANRADVLDTLAAAHAEAGNFSAAVEAAQKAIRLADEQANSTLAARIRQRLDLYQQEKPFHE
ncbi:MAG: ASPIC/UnbV domain-containing protein [Planctomycetales bacterium]|nr:ASPIC/UnbV domain-containing protein [Planctomycetales bacterium]